jgi:hypothetical protein
LNSQTFNFCFSEKNWFGVLLERVGESSNIDAVAKNNTIVARWEQDDMNPTSAIITKKSMEEVQQRICSMLKALIQ